MGSFSNYGTCLDIWAPGSGIKSAWSTGDTATNTISGTSMASPHVCGGAAILLQNGEDPGNVAQKLIELATDDLVENLENEDEESPNKFLYVGPIGPTFPPTPSPPPTPTPP